MKSSIVKMGILGATMAVSSLALAADPASPPAADHSATTSKDHKKSSSQKVNKAKKDPKKQEAH